MTSLERRVETLEERNGIRLCPKPLVFIRFLPGGELLGYRWQDQFILRQPGETEEALKERTEAFVLKTTTSAWGELIFEERGPSPSEVSRTGGRNAA